MTGMDGMLGNTAKLQVIKEVEFGLYLDGGEWGEILLPKRYVPEGCKIEDWVDVFVYLDSEDIIIATTETPLAEVGECALMEVVDVNDYGAFLNWGLSKDLFVPFREQRVPMERGRSYVVAVFEDNSGRICGSSKLDSFLSEVSEGTFKKEQAVDLLIASRSPIGYKAIINGTHLGLIHNSDALVALRPGERMKGYIKTIRPDDAIDLVLQPKGEEMRHSLTHQIMIDLEANDGVSDLTDKSPADLIFSRYQVSKGNYKKAIGQLYKEKKIIIEDDRIALTRDSGGTRKTQTD